MKSSRLARIALILVAVCAIGVLVAWRTCRTGDHPPPRPTSQRSGKIKLDAVAFKKFRDARLARAKELSARRRGGKRAPDKGLARHQIGDTLLRHGCLLGTSETCHLLEDLMADCDDEDAASCFALGQFVADNPPRALVGIMLFIKACDLGDRDACEYKERLQQANTCGDDPYICGWLGYRTHDKSLLEDACMKGMADACSWLTYEAELAGDLDVSRAYLEQSCQLGSAPACDGLARRLAADCEPSRLTNVDGTESWSPCYAIDEAEAREAREIACAAGFGSGCN